LDPYAPFRLPDYRNLLSGVFLANFGVQMLNVGAGWDLYNLTHSALVLGNVGFAQVAPYLIFSLWAGHLTDRYSRRSMLIWSQATYILASALLLFAHGSVTFVYAGLFFSALGRVFQGPARNALLPQVVPTEILSKAITWNSSTFEIANMSGPATAGLLIAAVGSRWVYAIQLVLSFVTLFCFTRITVPGFGGSSGSAKPQDRSLLEGLRFLRSDGLILVAISLDMFAVLFGGAVALLPIFAVEILHGGARELGMLRAAPAVGAVLMALTQAHSPKIHRAGLALLFTVAGFGLATVGFGLSRNLWLSLVMLFLTGAFDNVSVVLRQSIFQTRTPDHVKGRVYAVNNVFISCSNQLGAVESGWTARLFGPVVSVWGGGVACMLVAATCACVSPALRRWRQ
jgi:MFS family permease